MAKTGFWLQGAKGKLAGSIFGLEYYVKKISYELSKKNNEGAAK